MLDTVEALKISFVADVRVLVLISGSGFSGFVVVVVVVVA